MSEHIWADRQECHSHGQHMVQHRCELCHEYRFVTRRFGALAKWFCLEGTSTLYTRDGKAYSEDKGCDSPKWARELPTGIAAVEVLKDLRPVGK